MINSSTLTSGIKVIPSDSINIPGPTIRYSGVTTSVTANKLVDTSAIFQGGFLQTLESPQANPGNVSNQSRNQGVQVGDVVYNTATARLGIAYVTAIDSVNTLSLSADIFGNAALDGYAIYEGNGVNLNPAWGWSLTVASSIPITTDNTAAYTDGGPTTVAYDPATSTYQGDATFQITIANNIISAITVLTTGTISEVDIDGQTVGFTQAALIAAFGGAGAAGNAIGTIAAGNISFVAKNNGLATSKAYQLYVGGAGGNMYVTTTMGDELFIESIPVGTVLPLTVARVNVGAAPVAGNGFTNTLTSATEIVALT